MWGTFSPEIKRGTPFLAHFLSLSDTSPQVEKNNIKKISNKVPWQLVIQGMGNMKCKYNTWCVKNSKKVKKQQQGILNPGKMGKSWAQERLEDYKTDWTTISPFRELRLSGLYTKSYLERIW